MPLIQPTHIDKPKRDAANRILEGSGIVAPKNQRRSKMSQALDDRGLSIEDIADNLSSIARNAEKDADRIKTNELALKLHGELDRDSSIPEMVINFTGVDTAMVQVLIPRST